MGFWTIYISKRASFGETKRIPIRDDTLLIRKKKKEREQKQRRRRTNQQTRRRADPKQRLASRGDDRDGDGEHRDQETAVLQQNAFERKRCHFFLSFFLRQNVSRLFCALNNNLFYEDDDRYCSIKVMVYPSTTVYVYSKSHHHLFACRTRHGTQKNAHNKLCPCVEETSPHRNYYYYYTIFNVHV